MTHTKASPASPSIRIKVAAYQAPYLPFGSFEAVGLIKQQLVKCERDRVEVLCCPEAILGGLAHESDGQSPETVALGVNELSTLIAPLLRTKVTLIVGFTERDGSGALYNSAAIVANGAIAGIYRKVFPGERTIIQPGLELPVFHHRQTPFGVLICNDLSYLEPARVLAAAEAAALFVPQNNGHLRERSDSFEARGQNLPGARAVENSLSVIVADIAGHQGDRLSYGFSSIIDADGTVLARARPFVEDLLIADIESQRRPFDPRGWDGYRNPSVAKKFVGLWTERDAHRG